MKIKPENVKETFVLTIFSSEKFTEEQVKEIFNNLFRYDVRFDLVDVSFGYKM